jgi:glycosyltransferase involved in cell wall biosynthesis
VITLPVPIEPLTGAATRDITAVAYAADPDKRGLGLLCEAWRSVSVTEGRLIVAGLERERAEQWLGAQGLVAPAGVEWAGRRSRQDWLALVARARIFINASRYEDWGIAQLEALACGTPLVTVPTPGPNEALALARRLDGRLVAGASSATALAAAIEAGLALSERERSGYAAAATVLLEPYRPGAVARTVAEEVVPALLASSS